MGGRRGIESPRGGRGSKGPPPGFNPSRIRNAAGDRSETESQRTGRFDSGGRKFCRDIRKGGGSREFVQRFGGIQGLPAHRRSNYQGKNLYDYYIYKFFLSLSGGEFLLSYFK